MYIKSNIYQGGLIRAAYTGCSPSSPTTAKGPVSNTECLSSPNLVLESQGSPREQSVFSLHQNPKEVGSNTPQRNGFRNEMDEPAKESEDKQTKINGFLYPFIWAATRRCDPD